MSGATRLTLTNRLGIEIDFVARGGIITSIRVPDRNGRAADVVPGFDSADEYAGDARYMGALIGRYANRIAGGRFSLDGVEHALVTNDGPINCTADRAGSGPGTGASRRFTGGARAAPCSLSRATRAIRDFPAHWTRA